jgi:hypothetical protein
MEGSEWSRVSTVGADASPMLSPELVEGSSRKNAIPNEYKWTAIEHKVPPRQGRWISDDEIDDQTESLEDETDLTLERSLRKRARNSMRSDPLL